MDWQGLHPWVGCHGRDLDVTPIVKMIRKIALGRFEKKLLCVYNVGYAIFHNLKLSHRSLI